MRPRAFSSAISPDWILQAPSWWSKIPSLMW